MSQPCRGNVPRLVALLSGSLRPRAADRLRRHLEGCPGCTRAYERMSRTQALCREIGKAETPKLSWRQIEAQIHWHLSQSKPRARSPFLPRALALAAAAALGALATWIVIDSLGSEAPPPATIVRARPARVAPADGPLAAIPTLVHGDVSVVTPEEHRLPLTLQRPVLEGASLIARAGRAALQWGQESGFLVTPQTEVRLARLRSRSQELSLVEGKLLLRASRGGGASSVVARGIRASVKGTLYSVAVAPATVDVEVFRGVVRVAPTSGRWPGVDVPAGYAVRVPFDATRAPPLERLEGASPAQAPHLVTWRSLLEVLATTGLLSVESRPPGAELRLDSASLGSTNLALRGDPGRHLVELWREGRLVESQWVDLVPGETRITLGPRPRAEPELRLPDRIASTVRMSAVQIRSCYERLLKWNPDLEGKLTVRISIDAEGNVKQVQLLADTFPDRRVGQCAQATIQRWQFPPGKEVQVVYPFIFRPE